MTDQTLFRRFPGLLGWTSDGAALADELAQLHLQTVTARLGRTLGRLSSIDPVAAKTLAARLEALPTVAFQRVLSAPQSWVRLSYASAAELPMTLAYLNAAVGFEEGQTGGWSCLGDRYRPAPDDGDDPLRATASRDQAWQPPLLPNGGPIDDASPFARGPLPEIPGDCVAFEADERDDVLARIARAVAGIQTVQIAANHFGRFVRSLVLRKDPTAPGRFASASSQLTIGLVVLRNPQLAVATPGEIADGLIHEMIHIVTDIVELREPAIRDRDATAVRIDSPWTGRSLDLNTYIQACYVWYGLWEFWLAAFGTGGFDDHDVLRCFRRASLGLQRGMVEPLRSFEHALAPGIIDGLTVAQNSVQEALRQLETATG
jgi:hypothetical protein